MRSADTCEVVLLAAAVCTLLYALFAWTPAATPWSSLENQASWALPGVL
jgi:hypothetical protein